MKMYSHEHEAKIKHCVRTHKYFSSLFTLKNYFFDIYQNFNLLSENTLGLKKQSSEKYSHNKKLQNKSIYTWHTQAPDPTTKSYTRHIQALRNKNFP